MIVRQANIIGFLVEKHALYTKQFRGYAMKSDLKIKWVRPEPISCVKPEKSGDLDVKETLDPNLIAPEFSRSEELKTADDLVKKMFTLSFLPRKYTVDTERSNMIGRVQRHKLDTSSVEAEIARMTANIRNYQELFDKNPHDKVFKVNLKELIEKRRRYLRLMRCYDYKRFEWLLEELNVKFKPHPRMYVKATRKDSLRKLTNKYCDDLKQKRLDDYKACLDGQKLSFLQEKLETLQNIQKDEQELGLQRTVTDDDIEAVRVRLQKLLKQNTSVDSSVQS